MEVSVAGLLPDVATVLGQRATAIWAKSVKCYDVTPVGPWYILYKSNFPGAGRKNGGLRCEMKATNYKKAIASFDQKINGLRAYALVNGRCEIICKYCIQAKNTSSAFAKDADVKAAVKKWKTDNGKKYFYV